MSTPPPEVHHAEFAPSHVPEFHTVTRDRSAVTCRLCRFMLGEDVEIFAPVEVPETLDT